MKAKGGGCGEGQEVYAAENRGGKIEEDECRCWAVGHFEVNDLGRAVDWERGIMPCRNDISISELLVHEVSVRVIS